MTVNQASVHDGATSFNEEIAQALYMQEWSSLGAVVLIIWDMLLMFNVEYIHIWRTPSFALKWIYIFTRYSALLFQSASYYILTHALSRPPISASICSVWSIVQFAGTQTMTAVIEGVLMLRVYALYSKSTAVGWLLATVFLIQRVIAVVVAIRGQTYVRFDEICRAWNESNDIFIFGAGILLTQVIIWVMTFNKRNVRKESRSNARFMSMFLRDGAWAFGGVIILYSVMLPYSFLVEISQHVVYSWPLSLLSIATCRIIINIQGLKGAANANAPSIPRDPEDVELPEFLGGS
ncbi:hypothetical protein BDQ12DRAFT_694293 [Crucibulum laeve]|uniref:DUF6533 domain-containing protein n=1 Tax=Crucibulum laeve TaxID=68775 RepID=A0A5C3LEQ7_9AGAR|nr:hypothetical protein BDQ12DRAFT_694293 [Crucibulum laeve]